MSFKTADLCDDHPDQICVASPGMHNYGGHGRFCGQITTLKLFEDNSLVRTTLAHPGQGKVLVVDGGGSMRCALLGDMLARLAVDNGWAGIIIYGCIRDSEDIALMPLGVKALATMPLKSVKRNEGQSDLPVHFHDVTFVPGHYVYCDSDGIVTSPVSLI